MCHKHSGSRRQTFETICSSPTFYGTRTLSEQTPQPAMTNCKMGGFGQFYVCGECMKGISSLNLWTFVLAFLKFSFILIPGPISLYALSKQSTCFPDFDLNHLIVQFLTSMLEIQDEITFVSAICLKAV